MNKVGANLQSTKLVILSVRNEKEDLTDSFANMCLMPE